MYAVTSTWEDSRTRATFRRAEFGFFGVVVYTRVQTPRRCGLPFSAGVLVLLVLALRPLRTSCWIVGTGPLSPCRSRTGQRLARLRCGLLRAGFRPTFAQVNHASMRENRPPR